MRLAPGPIPACMPNPHRISELVGSVMDRPNIRLGDASLSELWRKFGGKATAWFTGSNVWMPAVFDTQMKTPADYDIIFENPIHCAAFSAAVINELNARIPESVGRFTMGSTQFGSCRIIHPDGAGVMDCWSLNDGESICEALLTYPHDYQRAAYLISSTRGPGCVFRIARDGSAGREQKEKIAFGNMFKKMKDMTVQEASRYPGIRASGDPLGPASLSRLLSKILMT